MYCAEDTGPTSRSHMSSTFKTKGVANSVGFATGLLLKETDGAIDCVRFCAAAVAASIATLTFFMVDIVSICVCENGWKKRNWKYLPERG